MKYLGPYMERLLRLAADASLREELTAFPLSPTADPPIQPEHRAGQPKTQLKIPHWHLQQLCPEHLSRSLCPLYSSSNHACLDEGFGSAGYVLH